jgi:hypothetical protein
LKKPAPAIIQFSRAFAFEAAGSADGDILMVRPEKGDYKPWGGIEVNENKT